MKNDFEAMKKLKKLEIQWLEREVSKYGLQSLLLIWLAQTQATNQPGEQTSKNKDLDWVLTTHIDSVKVAKFILFA